MANKTNRESGETALKVLLFDVECFPNEGWTWGKWEQNVIEFKKVRMICSIAWQWYPSRETFVLALPDIPGYNPDKWTNVGLMQAFHKEIEKADVLIAHNLDKFDNKRVKTDMLKAGLKPLPKHKLLDTLKVLRSNFDFNSNGLAPVCEELGIGSKVKHPGFPMWKGCMNGDMKSWRQMKRYNIGDVNRLLRPLYERVRPWMTNHPNMNARAGIDPKGHCPTCRSGKLRRNGSNANRWGTTLRWRCQNKPCGASFPGVFTKGGWRMG